MKRNDIFLLILIVLTIVFPYLAKKVKVPQFISQHEQRILEAREPISFKTVERRDFASVSPKDPFKIAERAKSLAATKRAPSISGTVSLIYQGRDKYVIINDRIFKEGETFESFTIKKILVDRVLLRTPEGEEIWLRLN